MRVLIIGASGMLGHDLQKEWTEDELIPASSRDADIRDAEQVRALVSGTRPDAIVLAAAYTDVDGSERNSELAFAINGQGAENVARAATKIGASILYVSTDYLYDGLGTRAYEPADAIAPLNVYGKSKAAGETAVRSYAAAWCIVRTSWLFGAGGASFPEKILRAAETRPELTVVADQTGSPTFTRDLAGAIRDLVRKKARGVVNVTNSGSCTWRFRLRPSPPNRQRAWRSARDTPCWRLPVCTRKELRCAAGRTQLLRISKICATVANCVERFGHTSEGLDSGDFSGRDDFQFFHAIFQRPANQPHYRAAAALAFALGRCTVAALVACRDSQAGTRDGVRGIQHCRFSRDTRPSFRLAVELGTGYLTDCRRLRRQ